MTSLLHRACRVTVNDKAVENLRVGFTVEKSLGREPNRAELAIYNLSAESRNAMHKEQGAKVLIEAGYRDTGMSTVFLGELRESFSRPMEDANWVTIVRSGDGDNAIRRARKRPKTAGIRPGVSFDRAITDLAKEIGVGIGNVGAALRAGDFNIKEIGKSLAFGLNADGRSYDLLQTFARSSGHELSVQDQQLQAVKMGQALSLPATFLSRSTGLEGTPEVDVRGELGFRSRILPGLDPGRLVQIESVASYASGVWRIEKMRVVGDTKEQDWSVECQCREVN